MVAAFRSLALACAALAPLAAAAQDGPAQPAPDWRYSMLGQGLVYATLLEPAASRFNPQGQLAPIPRRQGDAELRLNLGLAAGPCNAAARLRARYWRTGAAGAEPAATGHEGFLNEGGVRCRIGSQAELSVGRDVLQWGSSIFLSPSNPFFRDTGKTNPIQELHGKDNWQAQWFPDPSLTVAVVRAYRHGSHEPDPANFAPVSALKVDWIGDNASAGAIASRQDNGVRRLGLYGTLPLSKAALVYGDLSAGHGNAGWFAAPDAASPGGWRFAQGKLDSGTLFYSALAGAAYTFESGWTLNVEWLTGNEGYSAAERLATERAVGGAGAAFLAHDTGSAAAAGVLGTALSPNLPYLGRNYLFLQLLRSEWNDKGDVALRWAKPVGSGTSGSALSGSLTYYLGNHAQLFLVASRNFGGDRSDFGRLITSSVQTGIRTSF
ncbi:MAG: hypothetical protein ACJ8LG_23735 [Massilia sp.]